MAALVRKMTSEVSVLLFSALILWTLLSETPIAEYHAVTDQAMLELRITNL